MGGHSVKSTQGINKFLLNSYSSDLTSSRTNNGGGGEGLSPTLEGWEARSKAIGEDYIPTYI